MTLIPHFVVLVLVLSYIVAADDVRVKKQLESVRVSKDHVHDSNDGRTRVGTEPNDSESQLISNIETTEKLSKTNKQKEFSEAEREKPTENSIEFLEDILHEYVDIINTSATVNPELKKSVRLVDAQLKKTSSTDAIATPVNTCCDVQEVFNQTHMACQPSLAVMGPVFHDEEGRLLHDVLYSPVVGFPNCSVYALVPHVGGPEDKFTLNTAGELVVGSSTPEAFTVAPDNYCLLFPQQGVMEALVCFPDDSSQPSTPDDAYRQDFQKLVYPVCLLVSSAFLLLTLLVYCLVRELRQELLPKCFMCSIAMLCLGQLLIVVAQWVQPELTHTAGCIALGSFTHFSFLSAFLWLNVICVTVLRTLWKARSSPTTARCLPPFAWQCLYGFGVAGAVALLALLRDLVPAMAHTALPAPRFAVVSCWFSKNDALVAYVFGPIAFLLLANLICFCLAAYKMATLQKRSDRQSMHFSLYLKLFVLFGVSWIFEVISFFVDSSVESYPFSYIWVFFDLVNILQGVLIFLLFVCRPSVLRHLASKFCGSSCVDTYKVTSDSREKEHTETYPCNTVV